MKKLILSSLFVFLIITNANANSSAKGAENYINASVEKAEKITMKPDYSPEKDMDEINKMVEDIVDLNWVSRFILGKYWKTSTDEQKNDFIKYYKSFLISNYAPYFAGYSSKNLKLTGATEKSENVYFVDADFIKKDNTVAKISFRVSYKDNRYYITDIIAEGISFISTLRSDVSSAIANSNIESFIQDLKNRVDNKK